MLKIVVPIYVSCEEDDDELEALAQKCRNYGNDHLLKDFHACPIRGIDDKNSILDCPFNDEKYQYCTEIEASDWQTVLAENYLR